MKVYKFKDTVDGRLAYILAKDEKDARTEVEKLTVIPCLLIESRPIESITKPIVIINQLLPF